jgi:hypothetical protein
MKLRLPKAKNRLLTLQQKSKSIFVIEYLHEYESIIEMALAQDSWDPEVAFAEKKTDGQKNRDRIPLSKIRFFKFCFHIHRRNAACSTLW